MRWMFASAVVVVALASGFTMHVSDPPPKGTVELVVKPDGDQPVGCPIVVEVTMTNIGDVPVSWWCGGPDAYPGGEHFIVNLRYGGEDDWHIVNATNGQYIQGSGNHRPLQPGGSIVVPLAIPVSKYGTVFFTVQPRTWSGPISTECVVQFQEQRRNIDSRRMRMITAATAQSPPFWQHVAATYADDVVVDAMLKLIAVDNLPIAVGAARVLLFQKTLPASAGDLMAELVRRWFVDDPDHAFNELHYYLIRVAFNTQSEASRAALIKVVTETGDERTRDLVMDGLRLSPGDEAWLRRARQVIAELDDNGNEWEWKKRCLEWLDARILYPQ